MIERSIEHMQNPIKALKLGVIGIVVALTAVFSLSEKPVHAFVSGPPASYTGAPGEGTCTACHASFALNSGNGGVSITGAPDTYLPNQEVTLTVTVNHPNGFLYGFQVTALDSAGHPAGTLVLSDTTNTRLITGTVAGESRSYIEHTAAGTFPVEFNRRRFTLKWMSPATDIGPVTFYAAGNGANGDGDNSGDYIYTTRITSGCALSIDKTSQSFAANGGTGSFNVTGTGCGWTAISNNNWISITSGSSGAGNATVAYTTLANTTGTIRSGTITVGAHTFTVLQGVEFPDVPLDHPFYTEIGKLSARGITLGCGSGYYCPEQPTLRQEMAAFIIRALGDFDPPAPGSQRFDDVPPSNPFYRFIDQMAVLQITSGCSQAPPLYCPSSSVSREQMAAFMIRALGEFNPPTPPTQRFQDVPPGNPFYAFIDRMAVRGITFGCSQNPPMYCPGDSVTRGQMAAFLVRAFNL